MSQPQKRDLRPPPGGRMVRPVIIQPAVTLINWLMVRDVAAMLGVSKMTVYRLIHGEELKAVRVGRSFRVQEKWVRDFLKTNSTRRD